MIGFLHPAEETSCEGSFQRDVNFTVGKRDSNNALGGKDLLCLIHKPLRTYDHQGFR